MHGDMLISDMAIDNQKYLEGGPRSEIGLIEENEEGEEEDQSE